MSSTHLRTKLAASLWEKGAHPRMAPFPVFGGYVWGALYLCGVFGLLIYYEKSLYFICYDFEAGWWGKSAALTPVGQEKGKTYVLPFLLFSF